MFPGLGGMDPRKMKMLMKQMGIKSEDINARKVIFELDEGKLVIENPQVTAMDIQGKKTYTVMGEIKEEKGYPDEDVEMVAEQAGVSKSKALKALEENDGDIAEAISKLKE
ncbi:MAG: nascent polypeptide-associated complex protein [Candidatus Diapherotrites archaeon CG11_big_fil_rev_8_21_14_0_20_37_9]|nr:MAG: nascent polypeptide-associated complex protein [Candidatus Diapherotrites archaeon CG11_big_fil_rev_8_21_14_0_20_37_9]